jgi:hypothetical protein
MILGVIFTILVGSFVVVKTVPGIGPIVANMLRQIIGSEHVTTLEEVAAKIDDDYHSLAPSSSRGAGEVLATDSTSNISNHVPQRLNALNPNVSARSDGEWIPIKTEVEGNISHMFLTLLHPDSTRRYTELFVIAIDVSHVKLHMVPGTNEPKNLTRRSHDFKRSGLVPEADKGTLLAVFNGGFKTMHGHYGMGLNGLTFVYPVSYACTIATDENNRISIGTWNRGFEVGSWNFWRQTPPCLFEDGKMHVGLSHDDQRPWGAALKGSTITRRSALGVSRDYQMLYVGIGDEINARSLAVGMNHAGAWNIAQLDINWSYPKFAIFKHDHGKLVAKSLLKGFDVGSNDYIRQPHDRDFFYVTLSSN